MNQGEIMKEKGGSSGLEVFLTEHELNSRLVLNPLDSVLEFHFNTSSTVS